MEWLWSIATGLVGWWIGHRQSIEERKRGVEEGAQAAFHMHIALVGQPGERDSQRLKDAFKDVDLTDANQVRAVGQVAGDIYAEIIRRDAFNDARVSNFSRRDRDAWEHAFGQEMPAIGYEQGYLQGIRDVLKGAGEIAPTYLEPDGVASLEAWAKHERNLAFSWVDGKAIGGRLLSFGRVGKDMS